MSLFKRGAEVRAEFAGARVSGRGQELEKAIVDHLDAISLRQPPFDAAIEAVILEEMRAGIENDRSNLDFAKGLMTFSPSSADKCERELFYKAIRVEQEPESFFAYQRRWTRNGSAVHAAVQRDLLYAEQYVDNPAFRVMRTKAGKPAWEKNIRKVRQFDHNGVKFQLYGMCDGVLSYNKDGSRIGFEYKTKSTTVAAIGDYKLKAPQEGHRLQQVAYSLLFGVDEFLIVYESLAKDGWMKGTEAKPDLRSFYVKVTEDDRNALLDRFAIVAAQKYDGELPAGDFSKCIFCPFKSRCKADQEMVGKLSA